MGCQLDNELASLLLQDPKMVSGFVHWLAGECRVVSRNNHQLSTAHGVLMKAGGSSRSSLELSARTSSSFTPPSTLFKQINIICENKRSSLQEDLLEDAYLRLNWG